MDKQGRLRNRPPDRDTELPSRRSTDRSEVENPRFEYPDVRGIKRLSRKGRQATHNTVQRWPGWESKGRSPYHEYIHRLVQAGWDNLWKLDDYMSSDYEDKDLVVSVVDFSDSFELISHEDIHDVEKLETFLKDQSREGVKVRLYMAEQKGDLSSAIMEAFGSNLKLDPRFFQWTIGGSKNLLSPADRHRAPFVGIGFTVLDHTTPKMTDTQSFRITIYIQPDAVGDGWTGVILFSSHLKTTLSINSVLVPLPYVPPAYENIPPAVKKESKTFRELYLSVLPNLEPEEVTISPFYAVHHLLRLNCRCWNDVIGTIRDEDHRIGGISEASVNHVEDIRKTFDVVKRGGTFGWTKSLTPITVEAKANLEEDFTHLLKQADFLWETREKMAAVRRRRAEARWNALTNSFTFMY